MKTRFAIICGWALALGAALGCSAVAQEAPPAPAKSLSSTSGPGSVLTPSVGSHAIHIMPTVSLAQKLKAARATAPASSNDLIYHAGGTVITTPNFYLIYWTPTRLQNRRATPPFSSTFLARTRQLATYYPHHSISSINTQYYQTTSGRASYISGSGAYRESYTDTAAFPAAGCNDPATPGNCLTDAQIQTEIARVKRVNGWPSGIDNIYILFTPEGMGSCFDSGGNSCAYEQYCAYHSYFGNGANATVYTNQPYGTGNGCWDGGPSPSNDVAVDSTLDTMSHEISEAITDPQLNAWFSSSGNENGDNCNFTFGISTWDNSKANQMWSGVYFRIQEEYSNHTSECLQAGP